MTTDTLDDDIRIYNLSTQGDLTTAVKATSYFDLSGFVSNGGVTSLKFSSKNLKLIVCDSVTGRGFIYEFSIPKVAS